MRLWVELVRDGHDIKPGSEEFWFFLLVGAGLVLFAGLMSGLTLGLMSLDSLDLEVRSRMRRHVTTNVYDQGFPISHVQHAKTTCSRHGS